MSVNKVLNALVVNLMCTCTITKHLLVHQSLLFGGILHKTAALESLVCCSDVCFTQVRIMLDEVTADKSKCHCNLLVKACLGGKLTGCHVL